jgi:sulfoxide reductase heme-binding subunit YedZ
MDLNPHFYWYMARASGMVAFGLLALATGLGIMVTSRLGDGALGRRWVFEVHKFASLLALAFVGLHLAVLLPDPWLDFTPRELLVPGASPYRPLPVAMGVVALYAGALVVVSFFIRKRLGHAAWRAVHYCTFGAFALALLHGVYAGTDSGETWMRQAYFLTGLAILFLTVFRILAAPSVRPRPDGTSRALSGGAAANMGA